MKKYTAAVMMIDGFEESETVQIIDLLRRAGVTAHSFRFQEEPFVEGMQKLKVKADRVFSEEVRDYDVIVVPGGRTCAAKFIANEEFMNTLKWFNENNKLIAGMCSGTTVLEAAGVLAGKKATGYTGYEAKLVSAEFVHEAAVFDANVVTSQGPATPYPFAFKIMEALGIDGSEIKKRLLCKEAGARW
jgi:4-methyl-5(b-hydroxyethyl)-thiazole monophosphate biosynthesis